MRRHIKWWHWLALVALMITFGIVLCVAQGAAEASPLVQPTPVPHCIRAWP